MSWFRSWFRWCPPSQALLREAERSILCHLKTNYIGKYVNVGKVTGYSQSKIWTLCMNEKSNKTPIVLLHGFGYGSAYWCPNLDSLAADRPVYAMDILGFGRSSRPKFSQEPLEAEGEFVESIESWSREQGIDTFILMGHSFGGYLATAYAMEYPERISHLILVDPWAFPERPSDISKRYRFPLWFKIIIAIWRRFSILAFIRALGPSLMRNAPPDVYAPIVENAVDVASYLYHCNAQIPTGEVALTNLMLTSGLAWHKYPLINRIDALRKDVPLTFIYGSITFMDHDQGFKIRDIRKESYVDVKILPETCHNVNVDQPEIFNKLVRSIGGHVDNDTLPTISPQETEDFQEGIFPEYVFDKIKRIISSK